MQFLSHLNVDIESVKGFLDPLEGAALFAAAEAMAPRGLCVEIGTYCGKSTIIIGAACQKAGGTLLAIDHHRGSEENQPGEEYFDPDLDDGEGGMSTLSQFRANIRRAGLEDTVIPALSPSQVVARLPMGAPAFVFIDGGHSMPAALADWQNWGARVTKGGLLAIHDVFPNTADGGRPPHEIYKLALHSGLFEEEKAVKSLRILRRL
ncbi:class I SAM-dependent methyltransferase [Alphaproteobacteria bacterium]|nr:class I SAM-dependent methyltransferase [Alphaproteobacteria bacterium]MDA8779931.1 class I SAM-dependent methyltransferase [Alphaproteobacteria bacterium]MDA9590796.1 class I SAM-dependent methyltransferase [Alphaproteobacteria bacterium]MDB2393208.1 class I SAM-dependent methyltransferase [Alphaproteobacteria bacterium]MDB2541029.1 class I SAM-dependent methyltransferase [Alphaproteobacteria bacterium]